MWGSPRAYNYPEVQLTASVPGKHDRSHNVAELYLVVGALQSWGLGKLLFVLQSDYVTARMGGRCRNGSSSNGSRPRALSKLDLWIRLVELLEGHADSVIFAKLGLGLRVNEAARVEELALEEL